MQQIFDFEQYQPPVLTQAQLTAKVNQRKLQRQTALLTLSSLSIFLSLFLCMLLLIPESILLSLLCGCYLIVSVTGGSLLVIIFMRIMRKRRYFVW